MVAYLGMCDHTLPPRTPITLLPILSWYRCYHRKESLVGRLNPIGRTLRDGDAIAAYKQRHAATAPWLSVAGTS